VDYELFLQIESILSLQLIHNKHFIKGGAEL